MGERQSFQVIRLKDARILVESPVINMDDTSNSNMLVVAGNSIQFKDKKILNLHTNNIEQTVDSVGIVGMIDLCFGI